MIGWWRRPRPTRAALPLTPPGPVARIVITWDTHDAGPRRDPEPCHCDPPCVVCRALGHKTTQP